MKAVELWWSRELIRMSGFMAHTIHQLDDPALEQVRDAAWRIYTHAIDLRMEREQGNA